MTGRPTTGVLVLTIVLSLGACAGHGDSDASASATGAADAVLPMPTTAMRPDSTVVRAAETALARWLSVSREGAPTATTLHGIVPDANGGDCGDGAGSWFPTTLLADFILLPSEIRGDTIVGRAEVTTVAEQDVDRRSLNRFLARQRVQRTVLEWDVIPTDDGQWTICNGLRFGYRGADSVTTWRPEGSSYQTARALADSVFAARQSAPIAAPSASSPHSSPPQP